MGPGRWTRIAFAAGIGLLLAGSACGDNERRLPSGDPLTVVRGAAERTITAGTATVVVTRPTSHQEYELDLRRPQQPATVTALDLLRGTVFADPYGGQAIRGVGTLRYDIRIDLSRARGATPTARQARLSGMGEAPGRDEFKAAVWIDVDGRVRRVQMPVRPFAHPLVTIPSGYVAYVTYDYFAFGTGSRAES